MKGLSFLGSRARLRNLTPQDMDLEWILVGVCTFAKCRLQTAGTWGEQCVRLRPKGRKLVPNRRLVKVSGESRLSVHIRLAPDPGDVEH